MNADFPDLQDLRRSEENPVNPENPANLRSIFMLHDDFKHNDLTEKIINIFYRVYNYFGYGFLEKVYENAMMIEFRNENLSAISQFPLKVYYKNEVVGEYFADILVDNRVIVELKAAKSLTEGQAAQLLNYLKATKIEVGLLLNFGPKPEIRRKALNIRKE